MTHNSFSRHNPLAQLTAGSLALGGILGAAFVVISRGELTGTQAMLSQRWMLAHNLHFTSAALLLFGVVGLYLSHSAWMAIGGHVAFVLALLGTGFYFATGVLTAAILPLVAGASPYTVSETGPLFHPIVPALIVSVGLFQFGWFALGLVVAKAGILPRWTGWATALGALLGLIPAAPLGPAPWIVVDIAWVVFAIGLAGMGLAGWRSAASSAAPAAS